MNESFTEKIFAMKDIPYHLRSCNNILAPKPKTIEYGNKSARFLGSRIWHSSPSSIKEPQTLNKFKGTIRNYDFGCKCSLSKLYLDYLGFYIV